MFDEPQAPQSVPELSKENLDICKRFLCILGIEADKVKHLMTRTLNNNLILKLLLIQTLYLTLAKFIQS